MKKIWLIILSSILTISSLILLWSTALAKDTWDNTSNNWEKTKTGNVVYGDSEIGINFSNNCLTGMWKWCFDYEKIIWIDKSQNPNITVTSVSQDLVLAATRNVWIVLSVVIIRCGLGYIFAAREWNGGDKYKKYLVNAAIWALLVRWAYAIVRLIQYVAKG